LDRNSVHASRSEIKADVKLIADGTVLPAHPLALDANRRFVSGISPLTRYYIDADAGTGGGLHAVRDPQRRAYRPVLELAERRQSWSKRPLAMVAGWRARPSELPKRNRCWHRFPRRPAHSFRGDEVSFRGRDHRALQAVAREIPLVGFYLQPAVGGVILGANFWRRFAAIDNVIAIKIAPFNRYRTLDVLRGVAAAGALDRVALYTGNDDHILIDLMLPFDLRDKGVTTRAFFKGGLLGHWSVWTASAIKQFEMCKAARGKDTLPADVLALDARVTDCNSAFFDVANNFHGCIAGCHEVLRRQGLMQAAGASIPPRPRPGQMAEIDRVCREHADLSDDAFVKTNLQKWLA
jgi:hypothetical protein